MKVRNKRGFSCSICLIKRVDKEGEVYLLVLLYIRVNNGRALYEDGCFVAEIWYSK